MPKNARRPSRWAYKDYVGPLGRVIGISDRVEKNGATVYLIECAECGGTHERNAKHLKRSIPPRDCPEFRPHNFSGLEKRDAVVRRFYGISLAEYHAMVEKQGGVCAICGRSDEVHGRALAIDHCHDTGVVRGALCGPCNRAIGLFKDDPSRLRNAAAYLESAR